MPKISIILIAAQLALFTSPALAAEFPRAGFDGAPNGQAAPFAGSWEMQFPQGDGVVVSEAVESCDDPIVIEAVDSTHIAYTSPQEADALVFEVYEFEGRTTWYQDAGDTAVVVWLTPDSFHLHEAKLGKADWDNPMRMVRCD